jgi:hypothetical protein
VLRATLPGIEVGVSSPSATLISCVTAWSDGWGAASLDTVSVDEEDADANEVMTQLASSTAVWSKQRQKRIPRSVTNGTPRRSAHGRQA